jgi:hypothetical protein
MKYLLMVILLVASGMVQSQIVVTHNAKLNFFSEAPIEDIKAESINGESALNLTSNTIYFKVAMQTFDFKKSLMQEHFNENYMESNKYPYAEFKGKINEQTDLSKDGTYSVTVNGDLNIHGEITATSTFPVKLADHHIKIPRLVIKNIAEVVQVTVSALYKPVSQ